MFKKVDEALNAYVTEAKAIGVWESTILVQTSEFGRTLYPNGNAGTEHGWGGHYFAIGGGLKGGKILGKYPNNLWEVMKASGRRPVPTTPWDAVWNGVAEWAGSDDLSKVCPHKNSFDETEMFDAASMFRPPGPTMQPSKSPTDAPVTPPPSNSPTAVPTPEPTAAVTVSPTPEPTAAVTASPTAQPTAAVTTPTQPVYVNLALEGAATQSTTCYGGEASRAIDGNTDGTWNNRSVMHTCGGVNWWMVDLGADKQHTITSVRIYNRTGCCWDRLTDMAVQVLVLNVCGRHFLRL